MKRLSLRKGHSSYFLLYGIAVSVCIGTYVAGIHKLEKECVSGLSRDAITMVVDMVPTKNIHRLKKHLKTTNLS